MRLFLAVFFAMTTGCAHAPQPSSAVSLAPGPAQQRAVVDAHPEAVEEIFGHSVHDRFRWLESGTPEAKDWMLREGAMARRALDSTPTLFELQKRIQTLSDAKDEIEEVHVANGRAFYLRRAEGEPMAHLCVRSLGGRERTLFQLPPGHPAAISQIAPSPDGRWVAFAIASGGTEDNTIHFVDVASGAEQPDRLEHAGYVALSWVPGKDTFYYLRYPHHSDPDAGRRRLDSEVWLHTLNSPASQDRLVIGRGASASINLAHDDIVWVIAYAGSPYELACVRRGTSTDTTIYGRKAADQGGPWRQLVASEDAVARWSVAGGFLYAISRRDDTFGRAIAIDMESPSARRTILESGGTKLEDIEAFGNVVYLLDEDLTGARVRRIRISDGSIGVVSLPFEATVNAFGVEAGSETLFLQIEGWSDSPRWLAVDAEQLRTNDPFPDQRKFSTAGLHVEHLTAKSKDGTAVPLTVLSRDSARRPGEAPTLLQGYGAYEVSIRPFFTMGGSIWMERGGVLAFAHVRGGGELGRDWHLAGTKERKQNSVDDFLACAQELIVRRYTDAKRLAIGGSSAGGLLVGAAMVQRPDLFAAVYIRSGLVNVSRLSKTEIGPSNAQEYGSPDTKEGFQSLYDMDVYQQVKDGSPYPSVLVVVGLNDIRVPSWQGAKLVARLRQASSSGRSILLSVDAERGHAGTTASQEIGLSADMYSFLWSQFPADVSGRQPAIR